MGCYRCGVMNFEEWLTKNPLSGFLSNVQISNMETAWNAAIDEAIKSTADRAASLEGGHNPSLIIRDIRKLKQ